MKITVKNSSIIGLQILQPSSKELSVQKQSQENTTQR